MIETMTPNKVCTGPCGLELPATEEYFGRQKFGKYGLRSVCKMCRSITEMNDKIAYHRNHRVLVRQRVLSHYGGSCAVCGITDPAFLTIDHVDGGGEKHRQQIGSVGFAFYEWLMKNDFPPGFQVLCWNHNWLKYIGSVTRSVGRMGRYKQRVKRLVLDHYGGKCECCGEDSLDILTIDHINGGGKHHRREIGVKTSIGFYRWLRENDFPPGFRVLCFNHNCGRMI